MPNFRTFQTLKIMGIKISKKSIYYTFAIVSQKKIFLACQLNKNKERIDSKVLINTINMYKEMSFHVSIFFITT